MPTTVFKLFQSLFSWVLATIVVGGCALAFFLFYRGDEELRRQVELKFASALPDHNISVGNARFIKGEGVRLKNVSIVETSREPGMPRQELAFCEEVTLRCNPTLDQLVKGNVQIDRVRTRGLVLRVVRDRNGNWNLRNLFPSGAKTHAPIVEIRDTRIELIDQLSTEPKPVPFQVSLATIRPHREHDGRLDFEARISNDQVKQIQVHGWFEPALMQGVAQGEAVELKCNEALWRLLPAHLGLQRKVMNGFRGTANLAFSLAHAHDWAEPQFQLRGNLWNGRYDDRGVLSNSITDIAMKNFEVRKSPQQSYWKVENVTAKYDGAVLNMAVDSSDLHPQGPIEAMGSISDLKITEELVRILPPKLQTLWGKYRPLGRVDINAFRSVHKNGRWKHDADAVCKDISLLCKFFPYPVMHCMGDVQYRQDERLVIDLQAAVEPNTADRPIRIHADIERPGKNFVGTIDVDSQEFWLPLDHRISKAINPSARKILMDMDARGEVSFNARLRRDEATSGRLAKDIHVNVRRGSVQYDSFPYPLREVSGLVHVQDHEWTFTEFEGQNDSCIVTAAGNWIPKQMDANGTSGGILRLDFVANNIPCDAELRNALPAGPQKLWLSLRPSGHVDHATIKVTHRQGMLAPEMDVVITQLKRGNDSLRRDFEIQPSWFPLRMNRVTGVVDYKGANGTFELRDINAEYGSQQQPAKFHTQGHGHFQDDGSWVVHLDPMRADHIETTREFLAALPKELSDAMRWLRFQGKLWVDGAMHFAGNSDPNSAVDASWDATINIDNGSLLVAKQGVTGLFGQVRVVGNRRNNVTTNSGTASFGSLICQGVQVEQVSTPWAMDQHRLVFGAAATDTPQRPNHLTAKVFGGSFQADGAIGFHGNVPFQISIPLAVFDAARVARDLAWKSNVSGRGEARLELNGNSEGLHTLGGQGSIRLRNANLAKLPAIIELVNKMRVRNTRPDVFTAGDIDFQVQGRDLKVQRFDLHGESLTMEGRGWLSLDRQVDLEFRTILGPVLPALRPMIGQASEKLLLIRATGTTDNIILERELLPAINDYLFPELDRPNTFRSGL